MADRNLNPNKDIISNTKNEPNSSGLIPSNEVIEIDTSNKEEHAETEIIRTDIIKHNNVIILGKYAPEVTQNDSVQENRPSKRIAAKELKFLGLTKVKDVDVFGDFDKIYKKYRLRESVNKPNYKIPSIKDIPEIEDRSPTTKPDNRSFPCPHCNKENESKIELRNHIRSKHNIIYTCSQCFETFESNEKLISHKEIHETANPSHICRTCKVAFSNHLDYLYHMFIQHTHKSTFKCAECGLIYPRHSFQQHMVTHYKRAHTCPKCSKKFLTEIQLKDHLDNHDLPTKEFQCVECDQILCNKRSYDDHMYIHTGFKPHQCLYCGKGFRTASQRKVHTRIHTQEKRFTCTKCDSKFIQLRNLQRHLITHGKEKNYECEVCHKKSSSKLNLMYHMKIHSKKYDCPDCGKSFPTTTNLRNHALIKHSKEKPVECKTCNKSFATNLQLYNHKTTKAHKNQEFKLKLETKTEI